MVANVRFISFITLPLRNAFTSEERKQEGRNKAMKKPPKEDGRGRSETEGETLRSWGLRAIPLLSGVLSWSFGVSGGFVTSHLSHALDCVWISPRNSL